MSQVRDRQESTSDTVSTGPSRWRVVLAGVLVLVAVISGVYPAVSTVVNNLDQRRVAREYEGMITRVSPGEQVDPVRRARDYNASVSGVPLVDPWSANEDGVGTPTAGGEVAGAAEYEEYLGQLGLSRVMSRVVIPTIGVDLPVYHGTSEQVLQKGLGHLYGTSLPVGGASTHSVITGHSGLRSSTMFDNLGKLQTGEEIYVSTYGEKLKYRVRERQVVLPTEVDTLVVREGEDLLTLITCTPYGINSHRLLLTAERVPMDAVEESVEIPEVTGVPVPAWLWVVGAAVLLFLVYLAVQLRGRRGQGRRDQDQRDQ